MGLLFTSCGETKEEVNIDSTPPVSEETIHQIDDMEMQAQEIENANEELKKSSEEVDLLLKEI